MKLVFRSRLINLIEIDDCRPKAFVIDERRKKINKERKEKSRASGVLWGYFLICYDSAGLN